MIVDDSVVAAIPHLAYLRRLDNEFMRDHPGENFIPGEMQTLDFTAMKYRAASASLFFLPCAIFILFAIIPRVRFT